MWESDHAKSTEQNFFSLLVDSLPPLDEELMEEWMDRPLALKRALCKALGQFASFIPMIREGTVGPIQHFVLKDFLNKELNIGWDTRVKLIEGFDKSLIEKVEENVPQIEIITGKLEWTWCDQEILEHFGEKAILSLGHVFGAIKKQIMGEKGVLNTNNDNIFFVKNARGDIFSLSAHYWGSLSRWEIKSRLIEVEDGKILWGHEDFFSFIVVRKT